MTHGCQQLFEETDIVTKHAKQLHREIVGAYHITKRGEKCVSHPSVALTDKEVQFLDINRYSCFPFSGFVCKFATCGIVRRVYECVLGF